MQIQVKYLKSCSYFKADALKLNNRKDFYLFSAIIKKATRSRRIRYSDSFLTT